MDKHTPTPWKMSDTRAYEIVPCGISSPHAVAEAKISYHSSAQSKANAAFIVRAVNAHEVLEEVKTFARALLKSLEPRFARSGCSDTEEVAIKCLREAIAKAEGK